MSSSIKNVIFEVKIFVENRIRHIIGHFLSKFYQNLPIFYIFFQKPLKSTFFDSHRDKIHLLHSFSIQKRYFLASILVFHGVYKTSTNLAGALLNFLYSFVSCIWVLRINTIRTNTVIFGHIIILITLFFSLNEAKT